jgi:hypothetical protein
MRHLEYIIFNKSQQDLADLCMGHLDDDASLALTILTSRGAICSPKCPQTKNPARDLLICDGTPIGPPIRRVAQ